MDRSRVRSATIAPAILATLLSAFLVGCGSAPAPSGAGGASLAPGGSSAPGVSGQPSGSDLGSVPGIGFASADELAAWEIGLVDDVGVRAGLSRDLGPETWEWVKEVARAAVEEAAGQVTLTGAASRAASLEGGPPLVAIEGGGSYGVGLAVGLLSSSASGSLNGLNTNPTSTQTTTANGETTTATMNLHMAVTATGSQLEADAEISVDVSVADATTGAVLRTATFRSRAKITIALCPDVDGKIQGHITVNVDGGTNGAGASSNVVEADIEGTVGDDAWMQSVAVDGSATTSTTGPTGSTRSTSLRATYTMGVSRQGVPNGNSAQGSLNVTSGPADLTDAEVDAAGRMLGGAAGVATYALATRAQDQWRNGACVEIRATEESRDVQKNELVQFESRVWHKLDNVELDKNIVNSFAGKLSLDPVDIPVPGPVTNSFKAGPDSGDTGTITMITTSNRGIGEFSITFRVVGGWYIEEPNQGGILVGEKCGDPDGEWVVNGTYSVGGFEGDQTWKITINPDLSTGTFSYKSKQVAIQAGVEIRVDGNAAGDVTLTIDPVTGDAHMVLEETSHSFRSTAGGYGGGDQNAALVTYKFDWDVGGDC